VDVLKAFSISDFSGDPVGLDGGTSFKEDLYRKSGHPCFVKRVTDNRRDDPSD
jgi:hypothetical protein